MIASILAFICAIVLLAQLPYLPSWQQILLALPCVYLLLAYWRRALARGFCLGLLLGYYSMYTSVTDRIPLAQTVWLEGTVSSLPQITSRGIQFNFDVMHPADIGRVKLSSYHPLGLEQPRVGEQWRLLCKLQPPKGLVNSALFDYDAWLLSRHINATGYVRQHPENSRLEAAGWRFIHHQLRARLRQAVFKHLPDTEARGLLIALLIGENTQISPQTWQTLSDTGTNHLMIISGLHIGLVAAFTLLLFKLLCRHNRWALALSMLVTVFYGSLAGFGLPVQRAIVMALIALAAVSLRRSLNVVALYLYAMLFVLCLNPLAMLGAGFWLSFGAVLALIYGFSGRRNAIGVKYRLLDWLRAQWLIWIASAPLLLCWVMQWSLIGLLVNLIAIPIVGIAIVPVLLISTPLLGFDLPGASLLMALTEQMLTWLLWVLRFFGDMSLVVYRTRTDLWPLVVGVLGAYLLLSPRRLKLRWLGLIFFIPLFQPKPPDLNHGDFKLTLMDVGQGLAIMINTRQHLVVYDAGPAYGSRFDAGKQILVPTIRMSGHRRVDRFILSHGDLDHAGGAGALQSSLPILLQYAGDQPQGVDAVSHCLKGQSFQYDGVAFSFIAGSVGETTNNRSCVLRVAGQGIAVLLPGDIEYKTEAQLMNAGLAPVDLLIAPHHGSASSSSPGFLNLLGAHTVLISAGFQNRFRHPHGIVIRRYKAREMQIFNTATEGQIEVLVTRQGIDISSARRKNPRFWYAQD